MRWNPGTSCCNGPLHYFYLTLHKHTEQDIHEQLLSTRDQVVPRVARQELQPGRPCGGQVQDEARRGHACSSHQRRSKAQKDVIYRKEQKKSRSWSWSGAWRNTNAGHWEGGAARSGTATHLARTPPGSNPHTWPGITWSSPGRSWASHHGDLLH